MSNHAFNERIVPRLQPDPAQPGGTVHPREPEKTAMRPRLDDPETGFSVRRRWTESPATPPQLEPSLDEMLWPPD